MIRNLFGGSTKCRTIDKLDIFGDGSCKALYRLDGNANDESGNYHGTETNVTYGGGVYERGAVFNGSTSQIQCSTFATMGATGSISFWCKRVGTGSQYVILSDIGLGGAYVNVPGQWISNSNNTCFNASTVVCPTVGDWYHYVFVDTGSVIKAYENGIEKTNTIGTYYSLNGFKFRAFGYKDGTFSLNGSLDQIRMFNRAITAQEVATLYAECEPTSIVDNINPFEDGSLKALYKFDGDATDATGVYNGISTDVTYASGKFGNCAVFNGSSSKVLLSSNSMGWSGNIPVSFSAWIKPTSTANFQILSFLDGVVSYNNKWVFYTDANSKLIMSQYGGTVIGNATIQANVWTHVTMTRNHLTGYYSLYINGNLDKYSLPTEAFAGLGSTLAIHIGTNNYGTYANGSIDQVRIFNKALTPMEVASLYNETTPMEEPMSVQVDPFKDGSGKALYRLDGNALDESGNFNGTATSVTYGGGRFGRAFIGDGTVRKIALPNFGLTSLNYSVSVWAKFTDLSNYRTVFMAYNGMMCAIDYDVSINKVRFRVFDGRWKSVDIFVPTLNALYHFVLTVGSNTLKAYVDSVNIGNTAVGSLSNEAGGSHIGIYQDGTNYPMHGSIDQVRIFNRALTQSEVTALYNEI